MANKRTSATIVLGCLFALAATVSPAFSLPAAAGADYGAKGAVDLRPLANPTPADQPATAEERPEPERPEHGTVSGVVFDRTHKPVSGALVVVKRANRFATTNANGYYVISPVPVGKYEVKASRVGYDDATISVNVIAGYRTVANFALGAGPPSFEMGAKGLVEGIVVDITGCPLNGVRVCILDDDVSTRTDKDGAFSVGPLAPGFYCLRAECTGYLFQTGRLLVVGGEVTQIQFVLWADPRWTRFGM